MSLETDLQRGDLTARYASLKNQTTPIVARVQSWATEATLLHAAVSDPAEKAEVIAVRDQLVADINAALGV